MLRKLIKYDLKVLGKIMIPLWCVLIVFGIIQGVSPKAATIDSAFQENVLKVCMIFMIISILSVFFVNIIIVIQRFWRSMYGQEGYLTHTLPVTARQLILSKVISATIISFISVFILEAENIILMYFQTQNVYQGTFSIQGIVIHNPGDLTKMKVICGIIYAIIYGIIWVIHLIYETYTAMSIGQLSDKNRFIIALISGAFIFNFSYELQTIVTQRFRGAQYDLYNLIVFVVEILVCHVITELIISRRLNLT